MKAIEVRGQRYEWRLAQQTLWGTEHRKDINLMRVTDVKPKRVDLYDHMYAFIHTADGVHQVHTRVDAESTLMHFDMIAEVPKGLGALNKARTIAENMLRIGIYLETS